MDIDQLKARFPGENASRQFLGSIIWWAWPAGPYPGFTLKSPSQAEGQSLFQIYIPIRTVIVLHRTELLVPIIFQQHKS